MEILIILLPFVLLPLLIKLGVISSEYRLWLLAIFFTAAVIFDVFTVNLSSIGIRVDNLSLPASCSYIAVTCILFCALIFFSHTLKTKRAKKWWKDPHFLFLFIPISIAQQFLFQAFLLQHLLEYISPQYSVIITAILFGWIHIIFPRPRFNFIVTFCGGLAFSTLYYFYPTLILASLIHMVLNFTAVFFGFFTFLTAKGHPKATNLKVKRLRIPKIKSVTA